MKTIENKIDRERRSELEARAIGMRTWLLIHLRVARATYEVIEALAMEREEVALGLQSAVAVAPLSRVILESVYSITYVFDNAANRLPDFWKGAWRKIAEQHDHYTQEYGTDPQWTDWLRWLAAHQDGMRDDLAKQGTPLSPAQIADWNQVPRWPNPGKMPGRCTDTWRKNVLSYLDVRFYGPLSVAAHLSGTGMFTQGGFVLPGTHPDVHRKNFSDRFTEAFTMLLALLSQFALDVIPETALAERVCRLWRSKNLPAATAEVFTRHYEAKLTALSAHSGGVRLGCKGGCEDAGAR